MTRRPLMAGNWKMNKTYGEAVVLAQSLSNCIEEEHTNAVDVVVCTPFIDLKPVISVFEFDKTDIAIGAQNVYWEESGAFTGEISVPMISEVGCTYCIIGHSERRELFSETNEDVNKKMKALLKGNITPIVCVGESLEVRDSGQTEDFVCAQVDAAFAGIDANQAAKAVIAYEPIWAIGTGRTATPQQAQEVCAAIRATVEKIYGAELANNMRILYGGSMKPANVDELIAMEDIDGGLIGGASLDSDSFLQLVQACM